jgi:hypothetical protein
MGFSESFAGRRQISQPSMMTSSEHDLFCRHYKSLCGWQEGEPRAADERNMSVDRWAR